MQDFSNIAWAYGRLQVPHVKLLKALTQGLAPPGRRKTVDEPPEALVEQLLGPAAVAAGLVPGAPRRRQGRAAAAGLRGAGAPWGAEPTGRHRRGLGAGPCGRHAPGVRGRGGALREGEAEGLRDARDVPGTWSKERWR